MEGDRRKWEWDGKNLAALRGGIYNIIDYSMCRVVKMQSRHLLNYFPFRVSVLKSDAGLRFLGGIPGSPKAIGGKSSISRLSLDSVVMVAHLLDYELNIRLKQ